jgi:hypothetical protein
MSNDQNQVPEVVEPTIFYSKTSGGFFRSDLHTQMPDDVVEVSLKEYQMLMNAQSHGGKAIAGGPDGRPVLVANNLNVMLERDGAVDLLRRSARSISNRFAAAESFFSMEEACSFTSGKYAEAGERFRALRDGLREAVLDFVEKLDDEVDMKAVQAIVSSLEATAAKIMKESA